MEEAHDSMKRTSKSVGLFVVVFVLFKSFQVWRPIGKCFVSFGFGAAAVALRESLRVRPHGLSAGLSQGSRKMQSHRSSGSGQRQILLHVVRGDIRL